jgi:hypothetical protein
MKNSLSFLLIFIYSCGKSDEIAPVITLISPQENQVYSAGQTSTIRATITDNEGIHMIHLIVLDNSNNGHMIHFEDHFDGKSYDLNKSFPPQPGRTYTIEIEATDHNENTTTKQLTVSAN